MTAPIQSGYPDFGRYQAQATKLYAKALVTNQNADFTVDLGYVGDVANLGVRVQPTVAHCVVDMNFTSDAAGTIFLGNHTFSCRSNDTFARSLPVLGPFCQVTFFLPTVPADVDYTFGQASAPYSGLDLSSSANVVFSGADVSHPNGQTLIEGGRVLPGLAYFFGEATAANTFMDIRSVSASGSVTFLTRIANGDLRKVQPVFLPAQHLQLRVQNNSGVAQFFSYSLTCALGIG